MDDVKNLPVAALPVHPGETEIHRILGFRITACNTAVCNPPLPTLRPRYFEFYSLCQLIAGRGFLWTPKEGFSELLPGDGVLAPPGWVHSYGGMGSRFTEDFICFAGPVAERLAEAGLLSAGRVHLGSGRRLLPLIEAASDVSDLGQIRANALLQGFLAEMRMENHSIQETSSSRRVDQLLEMLRRELPPYKTIAEMAGACNLGEGRFRRIFREKTGMNPKTYMEELRMHRAAQRLIHSDIPLGDIARELGYVDRYQFSKAFKKRMGLAPSAYRRAYAPGMV